LGLWNAVFGRGDGRWPQVEISANGEEGFVDLEFELAREAPRRFVARGMHRGARVGFAVELGSDWTRREEGELAFLLGRANLKDIGTPSAEFTAALADLHGLRTASSPMLPSIATDVIALEGDPLRPEGGLVRFKQFFHSDGERPDRYAEVFLHVDIAAARIRLNEKDPGYRRPLWLALTTP
jgi:hypothetical protein